MESIMTSKMQSESTQAIETLIAQQRRTLIEMAARMEEQEQEQEQQQQQQEPQAERNPDIHAQPKQSPLNKKANNQHFQSESALWSLTSATRRLDLPLPPATNAVTRQIEANERTGTHEMSEISVDDVIEAWQREKATWDAVLASFEARMIRAKENAAARVEPSEVDRHSSEIFTEMRNNERLIKPSEKQREMLAQELDATVNQLVSQRDRNAELVKKMQIRMEKLEKARQSDRDDFNDRIRHLEHQVVASQIENVALEESLLAAQKKSMHLQEERSSSLSVDETSSQKLLEETRTQLLLMSEKANTLQYELLAANRKRANDDADMSGRDRLEREISELKFKHRSAIDARDKQFHDLKQQYSELLQKHEECSTRLVKLGEQTKRRQDEAMKLRVEVESLKSGLASSKNSEKRLSSALEQAEMLHKTTVKDLRSQLRDARSRLSAIAEEQQNEKVLSTASQHQVRSLEDELDLLKSNNARLKQDLHDCKQALRFKEQSLSDMTDREGSQSSLIHQLRSKTAQLEDELAKSQAKLSMTRSSSEVEKLEATVAHLEKINANQATELIKCGDLLRYIQLADIAREQGKAALTASRSTGSQNAQLSLTAIAEQLRSDIAGSLPRLHQILEEDQKLITELYSRYQAIKVDYKRQLRRHAALSELLSVITRNDTKSDIFRGHAKQSLVGESSRSLPTSPSSVKSADRYQLDITLDVDEDILSTIRSLNPVQRGRQLRDVPRALPGKSSSHIAASSRSASLSSARRGPCKCGRRNSSSAAFGRAIPMTGKAKLPR